MKQVDEYLIHKLTAQINYKYFIISEHWASILTYWWVGIGMVALSTFIIYNNLFSVAVLQQANTRPTKYGSFEIITQASKPSSPPGVFMHVFVNDKQNKDLNKYLPYIEVFANKYKDFLFNIIIVTNDTKGETSNLSNEANNNIALNSLWANNVNYDNLVSGYSNINLKYVTLTNYLNDSPIKKHWNDLPHKLIPFLVRAISVWDKGGIAINPTILTPQSPHAYLDKFVSIIKSFRKSNAKTVNKQDEEISAMKHPKMIPKVNNIRDIIDALEHEESSKDPVKEILHSVESSNSFTVTDKDNKLISVARQDLKEKDQTNFLSKQSRTLTDSNNVNTGAMNEVMNTLNDEDKTNNASNFLPLFLKYLFHNKIPKISYDTTHSMKKRESPKTAELAVVEANNGSEMINFWNAIKSTDNNYKPMIVSAKGVSNSTATNYSKPTNQDDELLFELTVDLKGNMIATKTPCHAFIGNVFINAIHHDVSQSLTDFIIKELSIFCKGLLASCAGIDVLLV